MIVMFNTDFDDENKYKELCEKFDRSLLKFAFDQYIIITNRIKSLKETNSNLHYIDTSVYKNKINELKEAINNINL